MANRISHRIQAGETVYSIATDKLGDTQAWIQLVKLNHLDFPYIVKTEDEKIQGLQHKNSSGIADPQNWLTYGDTILLPNQYNRLHNPINQKGTKRTYDTVMGMDLSLSSQDPSNAPGANFGDQAVYLRYNKHGDIATVQGNRNLLQSIALRLMTRKGALHNHPAYGSLLHTYIGQPVNGKPEDTVTDISNEILRTVNTDPRVAQSKIAKCRLLNNNFFAVVDITPITPYQAFSLYVESANNSISAGLNS